MMELRGVCDAGTTMPSIQDPASWSPTLRLPVVQVSQEGMQRQGTSAAGGGIDIGVEEVGHAEEKGQESGGR